jgi:hypothetical protein
MIPGVVDGTISTRSDSEGNVSFHVRIGRSGRHSPDCDRIEFVLSGEHLRRLADALADGSPTEPVPCSVGVRLSSPSSAAGPSPAAAGPAAR